MLDSALAQIPRFLTHLRSERRLSAHTSSAYQRDLAKFVAFCDHEQLHDWPELDTHRVRAFAAREHRQGMTPASIQRRLAAVRSFCDFLLREGVLRINPGADIKAPKGRKRLPQTLDADQMARLLEFRTDDRLDTRDKALMELLYSSGLRLSELVQLDLMDLDLRDRTVRVLGKGSKTRIVPVGAHAITALGLWLRERVALAGPKSTARIVMVLPAIGVLFGLALGFNTLGVLVTTPPGWMCVAAGAALMLLARYWTRRLLASAQPADTTPGLDHDLAAIAVSGGGALDRAVAAVHEAGATYGITVGDLDATLDLSRRAGVPAGDLLRGEAEERRRAARADAQERAAALSVRLMLPLGLCVLPAFMALGVLPLLIAVVSSTVGTF